MKAIIFSVFLLSVISYSTGQILEPDPVEEMPSFPGGKDSLICFINKNINLTIVNRYHKSGMVIVSFTIDTNGFVTKVNINPRKYRKNKDRKDIVRRHYISKELKRVFLLMPKWNPGFSGENKTDVMFYIMIRLPVKFENCPGP